MEKNLPLKIKDCWRPRDDIRSDVRTTAPLRPGAFSGSFCFETELEGAAGLKAMMDDYQDAALLNEQMKAAAKLSGLTDEQIEAARRYLRRVIDQD